MEHRIRLLAEVAERLISIRVGLGLDIEMAARMANVNAERLAAAEEGTLALDEVETQQLADAYGLEVTAFFGGRVTPLSYLFGA